MGRIKQRLRRLAIPAAVVLALALSGAIATATTARAQTSAPGEPGVAADWNEPSVTGFADSLGSSSKVWYTLGNGELENAFYPETDTPDSYGLQYAVTNGSSFTDLETAGSR
jgi:glucoamylase